MAGGRAGALGKPDPRSLLATHPIVSVVGRHNVGKTTFLTRLLAVLRARDLRIAVINHAAQGFAIDRPGTDSFLLQRTGIEQTVLVGGQQVAVLENAVREPPLRDVLDRYLRDDLDLVITEGYKREPHPKIEVARAAIATTLVSPEEELLAVVCDFAPTTRAPVFTPDRVEEVAELLVTRLVRR